MTLRDGDVARLVALHPNNLITSTAASSHRLLSRCLHHNVKIRQRWGTQDLDEQRDLIALELMAAQVLSFIG